MVSKHNWPSCYQNWKCQSVKKTILCPHAHSPLNYFHSSIKLKLTEFTRRLTSVTCTLQILCTYLKVQQSTWTQSNTSITPDFPFTATSFHWKFSPKQGSLVNNASFSQGRCSSSLLAVSVVCVLQCAIFWLFTGRDYPCGKKGINIVIG